MNIKNQNQPSPNSSGVTEAEDNENDDDRLYDSVKSRKKYKDVADAAQAAFESAAYAAAAARAAVELSRSGHDSDTQDSPGSQGRKSAHRNSPIKVASESEEEEIPVQNQSVGLKRSASSSSSDSVGQPDEKDVDFGDSEIETLNGKNSPSPSLGFQADQRANTVHQYSMEHDAAGTGIENTVRLNLEKAPFSVRTMRLRGF